MHIVTDTYWQDLAMEKTTKELDQVKGQKERVMAKPVLNAIHNFCIQSQEFARAVAEGGSFADCMNAVAKGTGNAISDLDAYKKAVQFYLPDAEIEMQMQISLPSSTATSNPDTSSYAIILNLEDYL